MGGFWMGAYGNSRFVLKPSLAITDFLAKKTQLVNYCENLPSWNPPICDSQIYCFSCRYLAQLGLRQLGLPQFPSQGVSEYGWKSDRENQCASSLSRLLKPISEIQQYSGAALGRLRVRFGDRLGKPMSLFFESFLKPIGRANSTRGQPYLVVGYKD